LRWVEQSSSLASGGSNPPGAKLWRSTTTLPGARNASQIDSVACATDTAHAHRTTAASHAAGTSPLALRRAPRRFLGAGFESHEGQDRSSQLGVHSGGVLGDYDRLLAQRDLRELRGQLPLKTVDSLEDPKYAPVRRLQTGPTVPTLPCHRRSFPPYAGS
jgi:hypothetical protein